MDNLDSFFHDTTVPKRIRDPTQNEYRIYEYLRERNAPASFYELERALSMSSGAVQATVKRCLKPTAKYRIYEGTRISNKSKRKIRVFSADPKLLQQAEIPDLAELFIIYQKIIKGELIENPYKDTTIFPLELDQKLTKILTSLVDKLNDFDNLGQLFSKALQEFLKKNIPKSTLRQIIKEIEQQENKINEIETKNNKTKNKTLV